MTRQQRPSNDLPNLGAQLLSSLGALSDDAQGAAAYDYRRFLRHAVARGWRAAAMRDPTQLRGAIDAVREARPVIDDALPAFKPRAQAAVEVQQALLALYTGEDDLREAELEIRLSDRGRTQAERAVLGVLAQAEEYLRQGEVHKLLDLGDATLTPSRVGQILHDLHKHGYAFRQMARARGRSEVSHYALAPRGFTLCEQLGIAMRPLDQPAETESTVTPGAVPENHKVIRTMNKLWKQPKPEMRVLMRRVVLGFLQPTANADLVKSSLESFGAAPAEVQHELAQLQDLQAVKRDAEPQTVVFEKRGAPLQAVAV